MITFIMVVEGSQLKGLSVLCISAIRQKKKQNFVSQLLDKKKKQN